MFCGKDYISHQRENGSGRLAVEVLQEYMRRSDIKKWEFGLKIIFPSE